MRFVSIESYMIPTFGNRRTEPYGRMVVEHSGETRTVRFGERDGLGRRYITLDRKRYYFHNKGACTPLSSSSRMRNSRPFLRPRRRRQRRRVWAAC